MTDTNAFNFGANENWFARYSNPQAQAERAARKAAAIDAEQRRMIEDHKQRQTAAVMEQAGPAVLSLIRQYNDQNRPALTSEVKKLFKEHLQGATDQDFQTTLAVLTESGAVMEKVTTSGISGYGTEGFMGQKTTALWSMEWLNEQGGQ
ncbi:hypothetical protein [Streptomyces hyaluromycini]|uniref:hypothetical protein n=1 Tax=Streptomyces hyaluromycini TaxID=1377993 RepID=UPI0011AE3AFB|nr:hypothetical protein [Streptomyces hyaluromycini]